MREQISLTYAKQSFKNNISKYGVGGAFENSILEYNLQKEEIKSLYKYASKKVNTKEITQINNILENYK